MKEFFAARRPHQGFTFDEYMNAFRNNVALHQPAQSAASSAIQTDHMVLNLKRSERIFRTFEPLEQTRVILQRIGIRQLWMVLSEFSCGDSAQILPVIAHLAALNPVIELRLLLRDEHPDIMDHYLTEGSRSIPKLVAFSVSGKELFQWGPRPGEAKKIFAEGKAAGIPKEKIIERIHAFYGRDRGRSVEHEFAELLSRD